MDAQQFLAEFGHIANAPGGGARLKELVLHLAVSGRLSTQILGENATDLLDEIIATRNRLQADGTIRVNRKIQTGKNSGRWEIPATWIWCRFGELCSFSAGRTPSRKEGKFWNTGDYPWFSIADLKSGNVVTASSESVSEEARAEVFRSAPSSAGSLLMSFKLSIGKVSLLGVAAYHNEAIITIEPFSQVLKEFFFKCLNGFDLTAGNKAAIKGNTLNQNSISNIFIALPPKNEIPRIVAKVDELMSLCDKLGEDQQKRRKLQNTLRQATLQAVANAQSPHELQASWARLEANFGRLFSAPEDARSIRDVVFDLALRGALVPDGQLVSMTGQASDELPSLPKGWEWKNLEAISEYITSGSRGWKSYMTSAGDAFIRSQDIKQDALVFENPAYVTLPERTEGKRTLLRQGDLLLTITGGNVGKCAVVPAMDGNAYVSQHVALIRLNQPWLSEYVHFWMINTFGGRGFLARYIYGDKPGLNLTQVGSVPIPVPPEAQAESILKSLLGYRASFELLETQLRTKQELASSLAKATVPSLTGIAIEQEEDEPVKVPQTELISRLRLGQAPNVKAHAPLATILARHNGELSTQDLWQRSTLKIDAFYAQLKTEVAHGWIEEPVVAEVRAKAPEAA